MRLLLEKILKTQNAPIIWNKRGNVCVLIFHSHSLSLHKNPGLLALLSNYITLFASQVGV